MDVALALRETCGCIVACSGAGEERLGGGTHRGPLMQREKSIEPKYEKPYSWMPLAIPYSLPATFAFERELHCLLVTSFPFRPGICIPSIVIAREIGLSGVSTTRSPFAGGRVGGGLCISALDRTRPRGCAAPPRLPNDTNPFPQRHNNATDPWRSPPVPPVRKASAPPFVGAERPTRSGPVGRARVRYASQRRARARGGISHHREECDKKVHDGTHAGSPRVPCEVGRRGGSASLRRVEVRLVFWCVSMGLCKKITLWKYG